MSATIDLDEVLSPLQRKTLRDAGMIIVNETVLQEKVAALNLSGDNLLNTVEAMLSSPTVYIADITAAAAFVSPFAEDEIMGPNRTYELVHVRQCVMAVARELTSLSLKQIAGFLGGRDHTTIHYGILKIEELIENSDPVTLELIDRIKRRLPVEIKTRVMARHG